LIATVKTTSASQSTIKLVATNLIACGKLKGRYLISTFHFNTKAGKKRI